MQLLSYFNAVLEQIQNMNETKVNPAPPTVIPEVLVEFKKSSGLLELLKSSPNLIGIPRIKLVYPNPFQPTGQLTISSNQCI